MADKTTKTQVPPTKHQTQKSDINSQAKTAQSIENAAIAKQKTFDAEQKLLAAENEKAENLIASKKEQKSLVSQKTQQTKKAVKKAVPPKKKPALPKIKFEKIRHDFGTITQGDTVDYKFKFINDGKAPLVIKRVKATCGCTQPSYPFMPIEAGEEGFIGVRYVSVGKEGNQKPLISVFSNASKEPQALMLAGIVEVKPEKEAPKKSKPIADLMTKKDSSKLVQKDSIK